MSDCEFSRVFNMLAPETFSGPHTLEATPEEREHLAKRLKILSIESFVVNMTVSQELDDQCFRVRGSIDATLHQASVISLKPVLEDIHIPFHVKIRTNMHINTSDDSLTRYAPVPSDFYENSEEDDDEDTEEVSSSHVDIGDLAAQYLALSLNPYPKNEGESFIQQQANQKHDSSVTSPFSDLSKLNPKPTES